MCYRLAWTLIGIGWLYSTGIAITPLYWNNWATSSSCELHEVVPVPFTMLVLTPNFALVWLAMFLVYWRIWREAALVRRRWGNCPGKPPDGRSIQVSDWCDWCLPMLWRQLWKKIVICLSTGCAASSRQLHSLLDAIFHCSHSSSTRLSSRNIFIYSIQECTSSRND